MMPQLSQLPVVLRINCLKFLIRWISFVWTLWFMRVLTFSKRVWTQVKILVGTQVKQNIELSEFTDRWILLISQKSGDSPDKIDNFHFQEHTARLTYGLPCHSMSLTVKYPVISTDTITTTLPNTQSLLIYCKNNVVQQTSTQTNGGATSAVPT
jgi:hypothetical protein